MPVSEPWKSYLDAGMELTQVTRSRAEKIVKELVKANAVQRHEAAEWVEALIDRSRKTTEALADTVRNEVQKQLQNLGLVDAAAPAKKAAPAAKKTTTKAAATSKRARASAKKAPAAAKKASATAKKASATTQKAAGGS